MNYISMVYNSVIGGFLALSLWAGIAGLLFHDAPGTLASMGHPFMILSVFSIGCGAGAATAQPSRYR